MKPNKGPKATHLLTALVFVFTLLCASSSFADMLDNTSPFANPDSGGGQTVVAPETTIVLQGGVAPGNPAAPAQTPYAAPGTAPGQPGAAPAQQPGQPGAVTPPVTPGQPMVAPIKPSRFESFTRANSPVPDGSIGQFGYDLFANVPSTFAPTDITPVGPDYVMGPGDELRVAVWGRMNQDFTLSVDREGVITLPEMGPLPVAGLTFAETKAVIEKEFSRYYRPSEVKVNVSMGKLRSITVYVVGKAARPGSYTVSSLSTLVNALFASGGPAKTGTLRDIRLIRNGNVLTHFDLYDFLLRGDKTRDMRLMPEDVIFIPQVGPMVAVVGDVKTPAIFELNGEKTVLDALDLAGGTNAMAFGNRLQLTRVEHGKDLVRAEADLSEIKRGDEKDYPIKDGDILAIFTVTDTVEKVVKIAGAVKTPGTFGLRPGMTVSDLLTFSGGLLRYAHSDSAELTRVNITQEGPKTERVTINLTKAMAGDPKDNITLKSDDYLFVRAVPEWELYRVVNISGEVLYPGTYTMKKGETISSLIRRSGGYTDKAYLRGAVFTRESVRQIQQRSLTEFVDRLEQQLIAESSQATQTSVSLEDAQQEKVAMQQRQAFISHIKALRAKGRLTIRLDNLEAFTNGMYDIPLEDGDTIAIPEKPNSVQVIGSVYNQTAFVFDGQQDVEGYIKKAGGVTPEAQESETYVLKVDGTALSRRSTSGFFGFGYDDESHHWGSGGFMSKRLEPGDTVVVPIATEKVAWMKNIKDVAQILFQVATSVGIAIAALP